jgi:hypothetical protein
MDDERPGGSKKGLRRDSELQRISRSRFCPEQPVPPFLKSRRRRLFDRSAHRIARHSRHPQCRQLVKHRRVCRFRVSLHRLLVVRKSAG